MRATAEVHTWCSPPLLCMLLKVLGQQSERLLGEKGKRSPPVQLPSAQPLDLQDARNNPQWVKDTSFQPLKHHAVGNKSTANLKNILIGKMLNLSIVHCCLPAFQQILYKCVSLPPCFIGDVLYLCRWVWFFVYFYNFLWFSATILAYVYYYTI